ncbi:MAG: DUF6261 family protein [Aerococcaceae bacterium]|nr:DUF6261 family protein [Aerococcaceae bacterium]
MTKLTNLHIPHLRHAELVQFLTRFLDDLTKAELPYNNEEHIKPLLVKIRTDLVPLQKSLEQVRASEKSTAISQADALRDADLQALYDSVKPYRVTKRDNEKSAYTALKLLFAQYKEAKSSNYEAETALVVNLLEKLGQAPYNEHVRTLSIKKFVDNLSESNTAFEQLFASRSQDALTKTTYDVKGLRKAVLTPYKQLATYVELMAQLKGTKLYIDFLDVLNNSRKYYADMLAKRKAH